MKYLLISHTGQIKEYYRMPSSIDPRDVLVELNDHRVVNQVLSLNEDQVNEIESNIPERKASLKIATKLGLIKKVA